MGQYQELVEQVLNEVKEKIYLVIVDKKKGVMRSFVTATDEKNKNNVIAVHKPSNITYEVSKDDFKREKDAYTKLKKSKYNEKDEEKYRKFLDKKKPLSKGKVINTYK